MAVPCCQVPCGSAVAVPEAPSKATSSESAVHGFDRAMTLLTRDTRLDVALMGEMDEVGHIVDLDPRDRFTILPILKNFQDLGLVRRDDLMTADALVDCCMSAVDRIQSRLVECCSSTIESRVLDYVRVEHLSSRELKGIIREQDWPRFDLTSTGIDDRSAQ